MKGWTVNIRAWCGVSHVGYFHPNKKTYIIQNLNCTLNMMFKNIILAFTDKKNLHVAITMLQNVSTVLNIFYYHLQDSSFT